MQSNSHLASPSLAERSSYSSISFIALFIAALGIRSYHLGWNPLWLDELYGYQLSELGVGAIVRNTMYVPHPPLYYFLLYLTSGFGSSDSEWVWRWFSALCGAISVPLLYVYAVRIVSVVPALLVSILFMMSPTHIFYSQEARPYAFLMCLVIITSLLLSLIKERPQDRKIWYLFIATSIIGLWSSYSFVMVIGAQFLFFVLSRYHLRRIIVYSTCIALSCLPLVSFSIKTLGETHAIYTSQTALTIQAAAQALFVDDPLRYGLFWAHTWVVVCFGVWMLIGVFRAFKQGRQGTALYHVIQVVFPVGAFFGIAVLVFHIMLPVFEWRQFLIVLPSCFMLLALGFDTLWQRQFLWLGKLMIAATCALILVANWHSLPRYWTITKSPEGLAARFVRDNVQPGDAVVSFHYSLDAALSFYVAKNDVFTKPENQAGKLVFARSPVILPGEQSGVTHDATTATIRQHARMWVMTRLPIDPGVLESITAGCSVGTPQDFPPFQIVLVQNCS